MKNKLFQLILVLVIAVTAVSCSSSSKIKPFPWTVRIEKNTPSSIEADLIGVTDSERKYYESVRPEDYWKSDSQIRRDADKLTKFLEKGSANAWEVSPSKPDFRAQWERWQSRGVVTLLLVARLPEAGGLWMKPVTLNKNAWDTSSQTKEEKRTIKIEVMDSRIVVLTPLRN